ncbi:MAG: DUF433 domain-containing protein [Dehalococcoidia bacterium]
MAAAATVDIGTLITRTPGVYGGRPCLAGTRFPVLQVAVMYREGMTAEQMREHHPELELSWLYAGIAHYLANRQAVDDELAENAREHQKALDAQNAARIR